MVGPVIAADGHFIYEKTDMQGWLQNHGMSLVTKHALDPSWPIPSLMS